MRDHAGAYAPGVTVSILIPVLARPWRKKPLMQSIRATCDAEVVFLATEGDRRELNMCRGYAQLDPLVRVEVVPFRVERGDYARKINHGVQVTDSEWVLQAADDLHFHDGWLDEALKVAEQTGRRVIGTNDLCNPRTMKGGHSTHSLVRRSYIVEVGTVTEPGKLLHEEYFHNFCDDDLILAAKARGEFASAKRAKVEHLHPNCRTVARDKTYARGLDVKQFDADRRLFHERMPVIGKRSATGRRAVGASR